MQSKPGTNGANLSSCLQIVETREYRDLARIRESDVVAVIYQPTSLPPWRSELASAVEDGSFLVPRTLWNGVSKAEIGERLEGLFQCESHIEIRKALRVEIMDLVGSLAELTDSRRFQFRIFTESPSNQCGFHVDTVAPGVYPFGLLQVYNGAGTEYIHPDEISDSAAFYRYLGMRERLSREGREAAGEPGRTEDVEREISKLDAERPFTFSGSIVRTAPAGSIVAFKHVDLQEHWLKGTLAWIHCSPMCGARRLVLNVTPTDRMPPGARATRHKHAP
jgi:hypothetical protein